MLHDRYLIFGLGDESYGLGVACITEIVNMQSITQAPQTPGYIKGIINLRGRVIPVMDLRLRFDLASAPYTDWTCIIIVEIRGTSIGLIVDHVWEVMTIHDDQCSAVPAAMRAEQNKYLKSIGRVDNEIKLLLDHDRLLDDTSNTFNMEELYQ